MTSGGADALKAAFRRSLPIIVLLVLLGIVAVNVFKHLKGPVYSATARVEISSTPLSSIITGTQPAFVDPQRTQDTAQVLAGSPQVYQLARQQTGGKLGSAGSLQAATSVSAVSDADILSFTATSSNDARAAQIANAVAAAYTGYRAQLSGTQISNSISKLQSTLATLPATSPQHGAITNELNRLHLLSGLNSSDAVVVQRATSATKTSPSPAKDSLLGFSVGLVLALIVVAIREAVDTTVRSESDVEDVLSAPVLASVRTLPRRSPIVTYGRHEATFGDTYALLAAQLSSSKAEDETLVLAVTSALAREGKTTTAANLAIVAARRGADVLLADFDFRRPALSSMFEIPKDAPGALQVLDGSERLENVLWSVSLDGPRPAVTWQPPNRQARRSAVARTRGSGSNGRTTRPPGRLHILPAGGSASTSQTAQRSKLGPVIRQFHDQADLIILDTPPALLTVEMTELAQLIDLVLVVVRQGRVSQRSLRSLARQARTWPAEVAGAVLTDVPKVGDYADYYGAR